jgi:hypothetical protein
MEICIISTVNTADSTGLTAAISIECSGTGTKNIKSNNSKVGANFSPDFLALKTLLAAFRTIHGLTLGATRRCVSRCG